MEQGTQDDEGRLTQLADFWLFEHLLSMPKSIAGDEMVYHLGSMFPYRVVENASLPAPVSARLFLRRMRSPPQPIADWDEQFQMLGLMCQLSCKREQFRSREVAAAMNPPSELIVEVLMQLLCTRADPGYSEVDEQGNLLQPLTSADVTPTAHALLDNADVEYLGDDEQLQNRLSLLEQLLRGGLDAVQLQQHLRQAFPADAVEEQLREYADKAWAMLGQTTLQRYQAEVMAGRLPFDPMQHFATLLPVATQAVFGDAADAAAVAAAAADMGGASASPLQQQPRARGARPVPLLGEATAPVLGTEELDGLAAPGSSPGKHAGRGGRQQQAAAAAAAGASPQPKASPMPKASPQPAKASPAAAAAAAAAAGGDDGGKPGRRHRAPQTNKSGKEVAAAGAPTRKQLDLQKSTAAAGAAAAAAGADEDMAAATDTAAAAAAEGAKKGRKSRKQQLVDSELISSEPVEAADGDENMPPAAAAAGSGGRKRGRKLSPAKAAAAAAAGSEEQPWDSSQPNVVDGVEPASGASQDAAAAGNGKPKGLGSAFQSFLNRPLDSLAAAAGGLAAVVRGSPVRTLPKERKICGAPQEGVKGRTVPWESPFGGSIDSPNESPRGKAAKSPAAAAGDAGRPAVDALKRKRAQADGQKGPLAAARGAAAAAAKAPDSSNTEYQDAREDAGSDSDAAPVVRRSRRQHKKPRREVQAESDGDSSIDDPETEKGDDSQGDEFDYDAESDEDGRRQQQQQQKRRPGRPKQQQVGRKPGRPAGRAGGASGGAAARAAAGFDPDFDLLDERGGGTKKRRRFQRWTAEEEALLIQLVAAEGEGAWAAILKLGGEGFNRRTQVDLKDKWRNLKKKGAVSD